MTEDVTSSSTDGASESGVDGRAPTRGRGRSGCSCGVRGVVVLVLFAATTSITLVQVCAPARQTDPDPAEAIVVLGRRPVRRAAVAAAGRPARPRARAVERRRGAGGDGHRRQPARRPLHRGRGVAPTTWSSAACRRRRSCARTRAAPRTSRSTRPPTSCSAAGLDEVVLVTDPYHSLRSRLIAEEVGLDASLSPTPTSVVDRLGVVPPRAAGGRGSGGRTDHRVRSAQRSDRLRTPVAGVDAAVHSSLAPMGCGVTGNTADSGSVIQGSIPCTPTNRLRRFT